MARFEYEALTDGGRLMTGTLEAATPEQAQAMLAEMRLTVQSVSKAATAKIRERIARNEFLLFNQQLASITKAGIPLPSGLRALAGDVASRRMRNVVLSVADDLEAGLGVEETFAKREGMFPPLYGRIVKAGVQTGRLSSMLTSLNSHLESANQTRRILFEAISYPAVVLVLAAVLMTGIFRIVIPSFETIYSDMGSELPALTRLLLDAARHIWTFWLVVAVAIGAMVMLMMALGASPAGRRAKESVYLRVPVLGLLYHRSLMSRLADAMALLVAAGTDMPNCLRLAAGATGSELLIDQCERIAERLEQGQPITEAGAFSRIMPPLFLYSIQLGSQRNELQDSLYSLAEMYNQQVQINQSRLQALLLPVMLIVVGGLVGIVVMAMFSPMVTLIDAVSS